MDNYTGSFLRSIASTQHNNFGLFKIDLDVQSKIIALGIRRKHMMYRWSRAGTRVFNQIHSIQKCKGNRCDTNINNTGGKGKGVQLNLLKHIASDKLGSFSKPTLLKSALVNVHSICNKILTFHHFVSDNKLDICSVTETWIKPNDNSTPSCLPPINFSSHNTIRNGKTGGGLAFVLHNNIQYNYERDHNFTSFECASLKLRTIGKSIRPLLVYRKQEVAFLTFVDEVVSLTERCIMDTAKLVLLGYFNLHINELADPNADTFCDLSACFNLKNNIFFPMHTSNNTLDLVLNASDDMAVKAFQQGELFNDHYAVHLTSQLKRD